jgi:hypothetical protein
MPNFLHLTLQALSGPAGRLRDRWSSDGAHPHDRASRAEQLEHIAVYARAGYFNLGYTVDAFHAPTE